MAREGTGGAHRRTGILERLNAAATSALSHPRLRPLPRRLRALAQRGRRLNLALQGGGAHGAFTWGVLDSLLADASTTFEGLSGSSAGAMNAVVMANGWMNGARHSGNNDTDGAREGAREALNDFWTAVGTQLPGGMTRGAGEETITVSPAVKFMTHLASHFSPTQLNPFDLNPLRDILKRQIDFDGLRTSSPFKLFVGTTEANTGRLRIFREHELTAEVLLASACLPKIHHPIEIDGTPYWDGGYSANPAVFPLFYDCDSADILLVLLSPLERENTPRSVDEIDTRIAELGFSAHFLREMRMFTRARTFSERALMTTGPLERRLNEVRFHMIDSSDVATLARSETKQLAYGPFLQLLREQGAQRGSDWLAEHGGLVGKRPTVDIQRLFA